MTAALRANASFLDMCRRNGVDPDSIPNAGRLAGVPLAAMPPPLEIAYRIGISARGSHLDALGREIYANNLSDDDIGALEALIARQRQHQKASASRWSAIYGQPSKQPHDRKRAAWCVEGLCVWVGCRPTLRIASRRARKRLRRSTPKIFAGRASAMIASSNLRNVPV